MDVRKLQLGDFLWIAKEKFGKSMKSSQKTRKIGCWLLLVLS